jgi:WD40 repeat protein
LLYRRVENQTSIFAFAQRSFVEAVSNSMLSNVEGCKTRHSEMAAYFSGRWAGIVKPYSNRLRAVLSVNAAGATVAEGTQCFVPSMPLVLFGTWWDSSAELVLNVRRLRELVYHLLRAGEVRAASDQLKSIEYIAAKFAISADSELRWELDACMGADTQLCSSMREVKSFVRRHVLLLRQPQCPWLAFQLALQEPTGSVLCMSALASRHQWRCREKGDGVLLWRNKASMEQLSHPCRFNLQVQGRPVVSLALSPDNALVATAGGEAHVRIWHIDEVALLHTLRGHSRRVNAMTFSQDGCTLASVSDDKTCMLWDVASGTMAGSSLKGAKSRLTCVAFCSAAPDGKILLAAGGSDSVVMVWDSGSRRAVAAIAATSPSDEGISSLSFSPDGHTLAFSNAEGRMSLWRVERFPDVTGPSDPSSLSRQSRDLGKHSGSERVVSISFSAGGKHITGVSADGVVQTWGPGRDASADAWSAAGASCDAQSKPFLSVGSPDMSIVASVDCKGHSAHLNVWDYKGRRQTGCVNVGDHRIRSMIIGSNGSMLAIASDDGNLQVWDLEVLQASPQRRITGHQRPIESLDISPDGKTVATGSSERAAKLWGGRSGKFLGAFWPDGADLTVDLLCFSPDGRLLAVANSDGAIRFWGMLNGSQAGRHLTHHTAVQAMAFSSDGAHFASVDSGGQLHLWAMESKSLSGPPVDLKATATCMHFGPHPDTLTVAVWDDIQQRSHILVWNWTSMLVTGSLHDKCLTQARFARVVSLSFNPDYSIMCLGCADNSVSFWSMKSQLEITGCALKGSIARFITASTVLVVSGKDVSIYDTTLGRRIAVFGAPSEISAAHACGQDLAVGCRSGELILLTLDSDASCTSPPEGARDLHVP